MTVQTENMIKDVRPKQYSSDTAQHSAAVTACKYPLTKGFGCTCKKSRCLKLYCQCFASSTVCDPSKCKCTACKNVTANVTEIDVARGIILGRNPNAFEDKFRNAGDENNFGGFYGGPPMSLQRNPIHLSGINAVPEGHRHGQVEIFGMRNDSRSNSGNFIHSRMYEKNYYDERNGQYHGYENTSRPPSGTMNEHNRYGSSYGKVPEDSRTNGPFNPNIQWASRPQYGDNGYPHLSSLGGYGSQNQHG